MTDPGERRRVRVEVRGRVQGVAFRAHTAEGARQRNVDGWVRNRSDGSVEACLEGAPEDVSAVLRQMSVGPTYAEVTALTASEEPPTGESGFAIRR